MHYFVFFFSFFLMFDVELRLKKLFDFFRVKM